MQRAETLFPASTRGLTAPTLYAFVRAAPFFGQANRGGPPLICSLQRLHQYFQYARKPDIETLPAIGGCPTLHIRTPSISGSYAASPRRTMTTGWCPATPTSLPPPSSTTRIRANPVLIRVETRTSHGYMPTDKRHRPDCRCLGLRGLRPRHRGKMTLGRIALRAGPGTGPHR